MPVEIASAYVSIVPTLRPLSGNLSQIFGPVENAAAQSGENAGGVFSGGFGKILKAGALIGSVKAIGEAAGAAFSSTFGEAMDRQAISTKAAASLGLSDADSKALGASAGKLYAQAYGDSFEGVTDALTQVKSALGDLGGDQLEAATKKAINFGSAFDVDVARSVQSVNTLLGSGLVNSADEAFDVLTKASQKVPAALREDVLDASDEYGQFFRSLGFDASRAFGALTAASDKGVFGIDKTGDAIKEFTIRATDMSTSSVGAFQAIGLDAQTMANNILAGGDTAQVAFQQIIQGLQNVQDPATQANTAIALFGTPLEDLGVQDIPKFLESLNSATGGLGDFSGAADAVDKQLGGTLQAKFTGLTRTLEGFGPTLSTAFLPVVGPVLDGLTSIATTGQEKLQSFSDNVTGFFAGFNQDTDTQLTDNQKRWAIWGDQVRDAVQGPLNTAKSYIKDFQGALSTLVTGNFNPSQWFAPPAEDSAFVDFIFTIRETVGDTFKQLMDTGKQVFDAIGPPLIEAFKTIWDAVKPLVPAFLQLFQAFNPVGLLFHALLPILPQIAGVVGDLARVLADGVARALKAVAPLFQTVVDVINRLMPFVTRLVASLLPPFVALIDKLAPLLDAVLGALEPVVNALVDALIPAIDALMPTVERVFTFIADTIGNIVQVFQGVIDFVTGIFTGDWEKVWTGVKEIFGGIWDQIKNIFGTLWDVIVEFFTNLGPKLWEIVTGLADQLVQWGGQFLGWIWQGIQDLWNGTIWPWFQALPGLAWDGIKAAASQLVTWGGQFLQWLWDGITSKWEEVKAWFVAAPGNLWDFIQAGWQQVIQWGSDLISWIWQGTDGNGGIVGGAKAVFDWFLNLPGKIWSAVQGAWSAASEWGGQLMKYVVDGISGSDPYVSAAFAKTMMNAVSGIVPVDTVAGLFNIDINKNIDDYITQLQRKAVTLSPGYNYGGRGSVPGGARGAVVPGVDPGPRDNMLGWVPGFGAFGLRSGEAVMVPQFTQAVGGEAGVHRLNRLAEAGLLNGGYADGGVVGGLGRLAGGMLVKAVLPSILSAISDGVKNSSVASNGQWGPATDGSGLAANTQAARDFIVSKWGITNIGGVYGGSVPGSDHPIGKALDVMIANYLSQAGIAQGTSVADWFVANPNAFGTKYVIWRDRINQGGTWAPYQHPSGSNDTLQHRDHVHLSFLTGSGQFQGGGAVPADDKSTGFLGSLVRALVSGFSSKLGSSAPAPVDGGAFPPDVERWRPLMADVLAKVGAYKGLNLSGYVDRGLMQINSESSGNPNAINNYDINARRGDPSIGLLQVIGSTFRNALRGTPFESLIALGQRDPRASLTASTLYSLGRYTTLDRAWRGVAYANGGIVPGPGGVDSVRAWLTPGEGVFTPAQTDAIITHAKALEAGYSGMAPHVQVYIGDRELTDIVDVRVNGARVEASNYLVNELRIGAGR